MKSFINNINSLGQLSPSNQQLGCSDLPPAFHAPKACITRPSQFVYRYDATHASLDAKMRLLDGHDSF